MSSTQGIGSQEMIVELIGKNCLVTLYPEGTSKYSDFSLYEKIDLHLILSSI